jgi:hypothetical protein
VRHFANGSLFDVAINDSNAFENEVSGYINVALLTMPAQPANLAMMRKYKPATRLALLLVGHQIENNEMGLVCDAQIVMLLFKYAVIVKRSNRLLV